MSNQSDVENLLHPHDADKRRVEFRTPELHTGRCFVSQFICVHIGLMPAIIRDDTAVPLGGRIDDVQQR
jgi:hypothetical protein